LVCSDDEKLRDEVLRDEVLRDEVLRDEVLRDEVLRDEVLLVLVVISSCRRCGFSDFRQRERFIEV
jgi:hypothetical protein